jgi:type I restriction enzyme S subunit
LTVPVSRPLVSKRLKYVVMLRRSRVDGIQDDRPYIGLENIESSTGRLIGDPAATDQLAPSVTGETEPLSNTFEPGDVLFGKLRPYLAKAWIAAFPGRCTTELLVMQPRETESRFLRYICLSRAFVDAVDASTFGSKMPRADWDFIGNMTVPVPRISQQHAIADYLDRETARLDALVAAKERVLGLLAEKRRALITQAVTRGLNQRVLMRDTGIEWIPQAPRHWIPTKISRLFQQTKRLGFADLTVLSVYRDYGVIERSSRDDNANRVPDDLDKYQLVEPDDLVINKMKAWQGSLGISELRGITSPDYVVFRPLHHSLSKFLHYLLRNQILTTVYFSMSNGIRTSQWRLEPDRFGTLQLFLPPIDEQREIVAHVVKETAKLDALHSATERTILLLKERRSALITEAVTGQVDVEAVA